MAAGGAYDEIEKVNGNSTLLDNLQQASTSGTQIDSAPVYNSDGSVEVHHSKNCYNNDIFNMFTQEEQYTELLEPIPEPHQAPQDDSNVIYEVSSVEQGGGTIEQHPATIEETHAYFELLYNNLAIEVEKVNTVNRKLRKTKADLTTELARYKNQEKCFEFSLEKYDKLERCYQKSVYQEQCLTKKINALHLSSVDARVQTFEIQFLKEATKFVHDFKSLAKEADESLAKHKALELEIKHLLRAVVSQDIISVVQNPTVVETSDLQTELEQCKYDKISYDKAYNDMQQKIERFQAQLGDQMGKIKDTPCVSDTLDPLSQKLEDENVSLEFQVWNYAKGTLKGIPKSTRLDYYLGANQHLNVSTVGMFNVVDIRNLKIIVGYPNGTLDLKNEIILGTSSKFGDLYLFDIHNDSSIAFDRAKQIEELFPLSDHKSKKLGVLFLFACPYVMTKVTIPAQPATENAPAVPTHKVPETHKNITLENGAYFDVEAEAIHVIFMETRRGVE
ncbi:hypothetical protein Tco_0185083 [Tanacetum coccineum]